MLAGLPGWGIALIVVGVIVLLIVLLVAWIVKIYNKLVKSRNKVKNSWAQIDVQLKRRFDLIPNLVETVKGYTKHENEILGQFAEARKQYQKASDEGSIGKMADAEAQLSKALNILVNATREAYPELKADKQYLAMMEELKDTENKIAFNRQFYNDVVMSYNILREQFPSNIIANMFNFKEAELFKVGEEEKAAPKVQF